MQPIPPNQHLPRNSPIHESFWGRLRKVFWNERERRVRSVWRIILFIPMFLTIALVLSILLIPLVLFTPFGADVTWLFAGGSFVMVAAAVISVMLAARFLDHRPFTSYGFRCDRNWWMDWGFGLGLGAFLMGGIFLVEWGRGWITITGVCQPTGNWPFALSILTPLIMFIGVGIYEELLFRGYLLRNMAEGSCWFFRSMPAPLNITLAVGMAWVASSALFGIAHILNPNSTPLSTLSISLAGIFLGTGYVLTRQLALPIGLHISWNLFQGTVFGFPVSGNDFPMAKVIVVSQGGPALWTGGDFGPEAGLLGIIAMGVGSLLTVLWIRTRYGRFSIREAWQEDLGISVEHVIQ